MRRRYRMRMNGNGEFVIQRRMWGLWRSLEHYGWPIAPDVLMGCVNPLTFPTSEAACAALIEAQERDDREVRAKRWTTVVEDAK